MTVKNWVAVAEKRNELLAKAEDILERAKDENRDLTVAESREVDGLIDQHKGLESDELEAKLDEEKRKRKMVEKTRGPRNFDPLAASGLREPTEPLTAKSNLQFRDLGSGKIVSAISNRERLSKEPSDIGVGDLVARILTGGEPTEIQNAVSGVDSSGGYLVTEQLSRRIIDLARSASVTQRAGAATLPITGDVRLVRVNTDPVSYWRGETQAITSSDIVFDSITLRPKMLACICPISIELLEDASNAPQIIESTIANSMAAELDRVILTGSGSANEPLGIRNHSSVNTQTSVGTPTTYSTPSAAVGAILTDNYQGPVDGLSWIAHPRDWLTFDGLTTGISGDNSPLEPTPWVRQLQRYSTTSLSITEGAGSNESSMIIGNFAEVLVGLRTNIQIQVLDSGTVSDGTNDINAVSQFQKLIRVYLRADVAVLRPTHFDVSSGVTNT